MIPPCPLSLRMAKDIAEAMLEYWPDCTPEKILKMATSYENLNEMMKDARPGEETPYFPKWPKRSQVFSVNIDDISYRYIYTGKRWEMADAMPVHLRDMF